jgi:hypothetical protein
MEQQQERAISSEVEDCIDQASNFFAEMIRKENAKKRFQEYIDNELAEGFQSVKDLRGNEKLHPLLDEMQNNYSEIKNLLTGFIDGTGETDLNQVLEKFDMMCETANKHASMLVILLLSK